MIAFIRIAIALLCVLALAGASCGERRDNVVVLPPEKPRLDRPDSVSMAACLPSIAVKVRPMTQSEVEALLGGNADRLADCAERQRILAKFIRTRDDGLSGRVTK